MPQSLSNVLVHFVFSTKNRTAWLTKEVREELFAYLVGVLENQGCKPVQAGGVEDHVHILFAISRTLSIANVVEEIKTGSSKWLKTKGIPTSRGRPDTACSPFPPRTLLVRSNT
jgi:REP element-mobilizing transposase RayT